MVASVFEWLLLEGFTKLTKMMLLDSSVESKRQTVFLNIYHLYFHLESPPAHRRRRINLPSVDAFDDELPPVPFDLPSPLPSASNSSTSLASPEPIRISCPICLDDDKTVSVCNLYKLNLELDMHKFKTEELIGWQVKRAWYHNIFSVVLLS